MQPVNRQPFYKNEFFWIAVAVLSLIPVFLFAGQAGGGAMGGGGFGGGFGNSRNTPIITADKDIRNEANRSNRQNAIAAEKAVETSINGKCDDEQNAWKVIAPKNTKNKNYDAAVALYDKAIAAFTTEKNKRTANSVCEQTLTQALELLK